MCSASGPIGKFLRWARMSDVFLFDLKIYVIQWSLVNPDAINPDASLSGRYFGEQTT
jgi:hypothetical protein